LTGTSNRVNWGRKSRSKEGKHSPLLTTSFHESGDSSENELAGDDADADVTGTRRGLSGGGGGDTPAHAAPLGSANARARRPRVTLEKSVDGGTLDVRANASFPVPLRAGTNAPEIDDNVGLGGLSCAPSRLWKPIGRLSSALPAAPTRTERGRKPSVRAGPRTPTGDHGLWGSLLTKPKPQCKAHVTGRNK
jgi:hypothetical protein